MFVRRRSGLLLLLERSAGYEYWLARRSVVDEQCLAEGRAVATALRAFDSSRTIALGVQRTLVECGFAPAGGLSTLEAREYLTQALRTRLTVVVRPYALASVSHGLPKPGPPPPPPSPVEPDEPEPRYLRRLQLGHLVFRPNHPALLPGLSLSRSPWAGLVAAALHMEAVPGDRPLLCLHQAPNEPSSMSELRAQMLHAFIRDDRDRWVDLQAKHGSIEDTQVFLSYLAAVRSWPLAIEITRKADAQTKAAVLAFQRFYNPAYVDRIHEDGIVGRQTLAAIFTVAKDDLSQWFQLNEADYAQLYHLAEGAYLACEDRYSGNPRFSIGAFGGDPRALDILFIPSGQDFTPETTPAGAGVYLDDVSFHTVPIVGIRAPQSHLLVIQLIDQAGRPVAHADYELVVGGDHRVGTTDSKGEIVEANLPDDIPVVKLVDGRIIVFHDRYRAAQKKSPPPKPAPAYIPTDEDLSMTPLYEDAEDVLE